jgi:polar amino acid transport system substrate-binding protein
MLIGLLFSFAPPAVARSWEEIETSQQLRIGVKDNLPPLGFRDEQGHWVGFEIDLARELNSRLLGNKKEPLFLPVSNLDRLRVLTTETVDLVIAQLGITPDRARQVNFSSPYYWDGVGIVVAKKDPIQTWSGLRHKQVAILAQSSSKSYLTTYFPATQTVEVLSYQSGVNQLKMGLVSGFAADASVMSGWIQDNPDYHLLFPLLSRIGLGVGMPRGIAHAQLNRRVNEEIQILWESGWLDQKAQQWGLP